HLFTSSHLLLLSFLFLFNPPPPTQIYTLSLHDALPISKPHLQSAAQPGRPTRRMPAARPLFRKFSASQRQKRQPRQRLPDPETSDRKSTRLNSSHDQISYAVFCLKKKKQTNKKKNNKKK